MKQTEHQWNNFDKRRTRNLSTKQVCLDDHLEACKSQEALSVIKHEWSMQNPKIWVQSQLGRLVPSLHLQHRLCSYGISYCVNITFVTCFWQNLVLQQIMPKLPYGLVEFTPVYHWWDEKEQIFLVERVFAIFWILKIRFVNVLFFCINLFISSYILQCLCVNTTYLQQLIIHYWYRNTFVKGCILQICLGFN